VIGAPILVAVATIVYLNLNLARHPHFPAAPPPMPLSTSAAPGRAGSTLAAEPDGIAGPALPWAGSLRLPVAGTQPAWFSPATGRSAPIGGLPADIAGYQFTRADRGWVVQASSGGETECGDCARPSLPVWFLADGARSATRVGTANQVTPAATADAVWLTSYPPAADPDTAARTAREVSLAGVPLGPPVRRDLPGDRPRPAARAGQPAAGPPAYKLWNPADPRTSRTFD
jgi:hypothetical protein